MGGCAAHQAEVDIGALLGGDSYAPVAAEKSAISSKLRQSAQADTSSEAVDDVAGEAADQKAGEGEQAEQQAVDKGGSGFVPGLFGAKSSAKVHPEDSQV